MRNCRISTKMALLQLTTKWPIFTYRGIYPPSIRYINIISWDGFEAELYTLHYYNKYGYWPRAMRALLRTARRALDNWGRRACCIDWWKGTSRSAHAPYTHTYYTLSANKQWHAHTAETYFRSDWERLREYRAPPTELTRRLATKSNPPLYSSMHSTCHNRKLKL